MPFVDALFAAHRRRAAGAALALICLALAGGCSDDEDAGDDGARAPTMTQLRPGEEPVNRGSNDASRFAEEAETAFERSERRNRAEPPAPGFADTPFEEVAATLPVREAPLPIQQYIETQDSHEIVARPEAEDFFCNRSPADREAAVRAFYEAADKRFKAAGIDDFSLVVTANSETIDGEPLARASGGRVRLTEAGRAGGPC